MAESANNVEHHKLKFPIVVQRVNSHLALTSGSMSSKISLDSFDSLVLRGMDAEGFVSFEIRSHAGTLTDDFILFHTEKAISRGRGQGNDPSTYQYYKRVSTGEYAFVVLRSGESSPRHLLGSIRDTTSKIGRVLAECKEGKWFTRSDFPWEFSHNQQQLLKACLDILTKEGILARREAQGDARTFFEYYKGTPPWELKASIVNANATAVLG